MYHRLRRRLASARLQTSDGGGEPNLKGPDGEKEEVRLRKRQDHSQPRDHTCAFVGERRQT